jgi:AcrR family transcriptional regulator
MKLKEKGAASKNKLLKSAAICFSKNGFDAASVDEICRHAGLSKGGFYHHFASKQDLIIELLNQWLERVDDYIKSTQDSSKNMQELFTNIAGKARPVFVEAGEQLPIFLELWIKSSRDPELKERTITFYKRYLDFFKKVINEGIDSGVVREVNPVAASRIIMAVAVGLMMQGLLDPDGADWDKVARESSAILIGGLAADRVSGRKSKIRN